MASSSRRWVATIANSPEKVGITLVRLMVGVVFVMHGWQKWFQIGPTGVVTYFRDHYQIPAVGAYAAMSAELGCGALLLFGLFTRVAAVPIVVTMVVAIIEEHLSHGFFANQNGYEFPLTLGIAALALIFTGPGWLAADNVLAKK